MNSVYERASFAVRRPDILWKKIRGKEFIEIHPNEIARYLTDSPVILEAGACHGDDTVRMAQQWPGATIHTFEPVPDLFAEVEGRTRDLPQVHRYQLALSDHTGTATFHVSGYADGGGNRGSSSLLVPAEPILTTSEMAFVRDITVQTMTMSDWAESANVDRIDFMWLDMQGMELATLKAAGPVFETTRAISMEVNRKRFYEGCPTYDEVCSWMRDQGFRAAIDRVGLWFGNILFVRS